MGRLGLKNAKLTGLFLLGCVLFNYPILSLFNREILVFGVPLIYLYLFLVWIVFVMLIACATRIKASSSLEKQASENKDD